MRCWQTFCLGYHAYAPLAITAKSELDKIRRDQDRKEKIAARKARNHALFMVGGLAEIAGLLERTVWRNTTYTQKPTVAVPEKAQAGMCGIFCVKAPMHKRP